METSEYTSISTRVEHLEAQGQTDRLEAAVQGSATGLLAADGLEESLWPTWAYGESSTWRAVRPADLASTRE